MATMKEQFAEAKRHIDAGHYREARKVLKQINHQTARQWEKKLDTLDIPEPDMVIEVVPKRTSFRLNRSSRIMILLVMLAILLVMFVILRMNFNADYEAAQQMLAERQIYIMQTAQAGQ